MYIIVAVTQSKGN